AELGGAGNGKRDKSRWICRRELVRAIGEPRGAARIAGPVALVGCEALVQEHAEGGRWLRRERGGDRRRGGDADRGGGNRLRRDAVGLNNRGGRWFRRGDIGLDNRRGRRLS